MSAIDLIKRHEGLRLQTYDDADGKLIGHSDVWKGTPTIGFGHTGPDVTPGLVISEARADALLATDMAAAEARAAWDYAPASFDGLDEVRQAVLIDMAFEMGGRGLAGFPHMLACIRAGDWRGAHDNCLDSEWARKEAPHRAAEDALMLLTGEWPAWMAADQS